jgi:diamine N-acetyltransferase
VLFVHTLWPLWPYLYWAHGNYTYLMASIIRANIQNSELLASLGRITFIESHGHSASPEVINKYVSEKFNNDILRKELSDPGNICYIIYHDSQPAGYSKIILDSPNPEVEMKNITKLERLYLQKECYHLHLGFELLQFNIELSKSSKQVGMWLYVWKENQRAVNFYLKTGFKIIGSFDFKLTESHSNPNHFMLLLY